MRSGAAAFAKVASGKMRLRFEMNTLLKHSPVFRTLYITLLVVMWVAATIANVVTIFGLTLNLVGLIAISVFIGVELVRSYKNPQRI